MTEAWHIDSLDARAGLAFVSWRGETLFQEGKLEEAPVFFIGAPNFVPVPVANRGVALAAERYGFQLGLLDENGEVPFGELDDVADFVRRLYLAATREDPTEPGATLLPGAPFPRGGPAGGLEEEFEETSVLHDAVAVFVDSSRTLQRGAAARASWPFASFVEAGYGTEIRNLLLRGARTLLTEILDRFPDPSDAASLERWRTSAVALIDILYRLGLVAELVGDLATQRKCSEFLMGSWSQVEAITRLDSDSVASALEVMAYQTLHHPWPFGLVPRRGQFSLEPFEELSRLPLPMSLGKAIGTASPDRASVATLLSTVLGYPATMTTTKGVTSILIFAACCVTAIDGAPIVAFQPYGMRVPGDWHDKTSSFRYEQMSAAALTWLASNLPQFAFRPELEKMIAAVGSATTEEPEPSASSEPKKTRGTYWAEEASSASPIEQNGALYS